MNARVKFDAGDPELRKTGLGASDMPVVLGLSPFSDPYQLWQEKIGLVPPFEGNAATRWGKALEQPVAAFFAEELGKKIRRSHRTHRQRNNKWAMAHPDRKVIGERSILEVKTTNFPDDWGDEFTDQIPAHYLAQVHHQLWVMDLDLCYVAVGILSRRVNRYYKVERDPEWDTLLEEYGSAFWKLVQSKTAPTIDYMAPGILAALSKAYTPDGNIVSFGATEQALHNSLVTLQERQKSLTGAIDGIKAELLHTLKTNWLGLLPDGGCYRRQVSPRKGFSVEPNPDAIDFRFLKNIPKGVEL